MARTTFISLTVARSRSRCRSNWPAVLPAPAPPRVVSPNLDPLTLGIDARPFGRGPLAFVSVREAGHRCANFERAFASDGRFWTALRDGSPGWIAPMSPFFATFRCGVIRQSPPERLQAACSPRPVPLQSLLLWSDEPVLRRQGLDFVGRRGTAGDRDLPDGVGCLGSAPSILLPPISVRRPRPCH